MMTIRTMVPVAGAEATHEDVVARLRATGSPEESAVVLARRVPALDLTEAEEVSRAEGRSVLLAAQQGGPVLAARWFAPDAATTIHDHGSWGAAVVCRGGARYEHWSRSGSGARLTGVSEFGAGQWTTWAAPPDDVHRQSAGPHGCLEVVLLGSEPTGSRDLAPTAGVLEQGVAALSTYDFPALAEHYCGDVLFDANIPTWRYQLRGPAAILEVAREQLSGITDLTVTRLRATYADEMATVEVAVRFGTGHRAQRWREVHLLRRDDDQIVEHTVYCTGTWDTATIARHTAQAPMVRP